LLEVCKSLGTTIPLPLLGRPDKVVGLSVVGEGGMPRSYPTNCDIGHGRANGSPKLL
jgi:hypothetical protein